MKSVASVHCCISGWLFLIIINFVKSNKNGVIEKESQNHKSVVDLYYARRKDFATSNLGSVLFKNADPSTLGQNYNYNKYLIFVELGGKEEELRLLNTTTDVLAGCSVDNCIYSDDSNYLQSADAVVINVHKVENYITQAQKRSPNQIWILYNEESPFHAPLPQSNVNLSHLFNWTMSYNSESDIPIPYGRTVPLPTALRVETVDTEKALRQMVPFWNKKQFDVLAAIIISDCIRIRKLMLAKLFKLVSIDVQMRWCQNSWSKYLLPDYNNTKYIFYLAFENSNCPQYFTEKIFYNAYSKGAIPVILGPPYDDCFRLLPPNSFLHVDSYKSVEDLAKHMHLIASNKILLLSYHVWRKHFAVTNEHGYFGTTSTHLCRVCEALNFNNPAPKSYHSDELKFCNSNYEFEHPDI